MQKHYGKGGGGEMVSWGKKLKIGVREINIKKQENYTKKGRKGCIFLGYKPKLICRGKIINLKRGENGNGNQGGEMIKMHNIYP